ncbi:MAG: CRISPR-associated helicase Cas3' [Spirochaetales bacterium]|nr:CRISPR-associated helicase Cas3' [Spirochaetales bacterium]
MRLKSRSTESRDDGDSSLPKQKDLIAKTFPEEETEKYRIMNLYTHCLIVGLTAREIAKRFPEWLENKLFPSGYELVCAVHDIGKAYPHFLEKIMRSGVPEYQANTFTGLEGAEPSTEKANGYHWSVSRAALKEIRDTGPYIPEIAGRHHGVSPNTMGRATDERYGGIQWQALREELVYDLKNTLDTEWPIITDNTHASVISGLTSVSDWVGSGISGLDAYEDELNKIEAIVKERVDKAGFLVPKVQEGLQFEDVFDGYNPYPLQKAFIDTVSGPGIYSIEEQMGRGKTEAALYAAYLLLQNGMARGIYFALPTKLTSDRIFHRFNSFLDNILDTKGSKSASLLLHGDSWLKWAEMSEAGLPGNEWFAHRRRAILAPFAVGTVDQALMAVMNVRYGFVRTFGLAGKVVILDEVHSYDSYTGRLLDVLVAELHKLGCTVIILSATLTKGRRKSIMGLETPIALETAYPLAIAHTDEKEIKSTSIDDGEQCEIGVRLITNDEEAFEEALCRAEEGQQVLWIENTVAEAQNRYRMCGARSSDMPVSVGLLHSRFLQCHRMDIENNWVEAFGKGGGQTRYPKGRILIGTQVLEQSLDIDADFIVTNIAPIDMILQRIGRLWRHRNYDSMRPTGAKREVFIISPTVEKVSGNPAHAFGPSGYVYAPYILARTLEVLRNREQLEFPRDIRLLLENTYADREEAELKFVKQELLSEAEKLRSLAAVGIATGGKTLPESKASTRYSDRETAEVLLLKNMVHQKDVTYLEFLDGTKLNLPRRNTSKISTNERKDVALKINPQLVTVAEHMAPKAVNRSELLWLSPYIYIGDEEHQPFRIALVGKDGLLTWNASDRVNDKYTLHYRADIGYIADKKSE